ncbi:MAG: hypothetical protein IT259_03680 [Saprospiraceae bacterium]|nr:hypothetical protein [Saprospiraceae bacterium]
MITRNKILLGALIAFILLAILIFRPVPLPPEEDCLVVTGVVTEIYENKGYDVIFKLKDNPNLYYVNRGTQRGIDLNAIQQRLLNQPVTFKYPRYWTPLDWNNTVRHLSKIIHNGETVFTEIG